MKIAKVETLHCDGGWRPWTFVRVETDDGLIGWGECSDSRSPYGIAGAVRDMEDLLLGQDPRPVERLYWDMLRRTRQNLGGVTHKAIAGVELALWDIKAKALGVPVYELFGGKVRDRIRVYWSHCATWRINHPDWFKPAITSLDGVKSIGNEVREKGFTAMKTNIFVYTDGKPQGWRPGFGSPFEPELNVDRKLLRNLCMHLEAIRDGAGPDVDILLDLNFNAKTEGYLKILREIADLDMFWIEIDSFSPEALGYIRRQSPHPVSSCETLTGLREFLPYFSAQAIDVAIIDTPWNGVWQSMKIAASAEAHEVNVAPHNFYGHLCTMMNAHFAAAVADSGFTFIGPPAEAIEMMGDKSAARRAADRVGVPIVPGTPEPVTLAQAPAEAERIGFPVMVKAAFGGGGKGMQVVRKPEELESALARATREAQAYFGRPEVFLERYIDRAHHVEATRPRHRKVGHDDVDVGDCRGIGRHGISLWLPGMTLSVRVFRRHRVLSRTRTIGGL